MYEHKKQIGKYLIRGAWSIEILAALTGVAIAFINGYDAAIEIEKIHGQIPAGMRFDILIAALPFMMVAVAEISKIPFVYIFYGAEKTHWRLMFGGILLLLIFVTFETMVNGFQRNFTNLTYEIEQPRNEHIRLTEELNELNRQIEERESLSEESISSDIQKIIDDAQVLRDSTIENLKKQKEEVLLSHGGDISRQINSHIKQIEVLRDERDQEISRIIAERDSRIKLDSESVSPEVLQALRDERKDLQNQLSQLNADETEETKNCFFCGAERAKYQSLREPIEERIAAINEQLSMTARNISSSVIGEYSGKINKIKNDYDRKISSIEDKMKPLESRLANNTAIKSKLADIDQQIEGARSVFENNKERAQKVRAKKSTELEGNEGIVAELKRKVSLAEKSRNEIRDVINEKVRNNQIYNFTMMIYGHDSAADVTRDEVKNIVSIWFGSIAMIVAIVGTGMAFGGIILQEHFPPRKPSKKKVANAVRYALISLRRRLREPKIVEKVVEKEVDKIVEVTKEVPVDKVVFKEVPVEVIKKELIHVPVYTNDPELLGKPYK